MQEITEQQMVTEALKLAALKAKNKGKAGTDYDVLKALVAIYPETSNWPGIKLTQILRTIRNV